MPEWSMSRRSPRHAIQIPFLHMRRAAASAGAGVGWRRNLSEGDACLELAGPLRDFPPIPSHREGTGRPPDANGEPS